MPWKAGEVRLRISLCTRNSFPSEERKMVSASGASKSYGAMGKDIGGTPAQTVADVTVNLRERGYVKYADVITKNSHDCNVLSLG